MAEKKFTCYDLFVNLISLLTFLVDIGTDILVAVEFYEKGHIVWGSLSVLFIALPAVVMQFFSIKWYYNDGSLTCLTFLPHLLLLGPVFRYVGVIRQGLKARQKTGDVVRHTSNVFNQQNDISILRLIEAFLESAPQLCLHLYIVLITLEIDWLSGLKDSSVPTDDETAGVSLVSSLLSLSWAITAYTDALRLAYQVGYTRRWIGLILHTIWRNFMITARVTALVLFASVFKAWVFLVVGIHWLVMTIIIGIQGIDFGDGWLETNLFRMVAGFIHIFCFLNVKDGSTRLRLAGFYILIILENVGLWVCWYFYTDVPELATISGVIVFGSFVLGLVFLLIYYGSCHPGGPISILQINPPVTYQPTIVRRGDRNQETRKDIFNQSDSILDYNQSRYTMVDLSGFQSPKGQGGDGEQGPSSPFVHSATNTPCPRTATDRNLMAIWESSSQLALNNSDQGGFKNSNSQSKLSVISDQTQQRQSKTKDEDYSIMYNEGTDGLMFRIRSQKDLRNSDCSPYSVTNLSIINSNPCSLSPLDAHKLWEESKRRLSRSPISTSSSESSIQKFFRGEKARSSISSTYSSEIFNDNNITVREAPPPQDGVPVYNLESHPVIIKPPVPVFETFNDSAEIQHGSVLKLKNDFDQDIRNEQKKQQVTEKYFTAKHHQSSNSPVSKDLPIPSFAPPAPTMAATNPKKLVSFSSNLVELEPVYNHYKYGCLTPDVLNFPTPEKLRSFQNQNEWNSEIPSRSYSNQNESSPNTSNNSGGAQEAPVCINSSILSGNSCCSPTFPFIDETCSEASSEKSSVRPPCDPKVCYMSAVTQLADNEVAEVMQNSVEEQELGCVDTVGPIQQAPVLPESLYHPSSMRQPQDRTVVDGHDLRKNTNDCNRSWPDEIVTPVAVEQVRSPPSYKEACQRSKVLSFIKGTQEASEAIPENCELGFDASQLPISSRDASLRLDYLNIDPSPNINMSGNPKLRSEKHSKYRLNVSDPGSTPIKLQEFEDSPAKFGRNIDLFKTGDWNRLEDQNVGRNSQKSVSRRPLSGNFEMREMEASPYTLELSDVPENSKENDIDPNSMSPPLKSSSLKTSLARKRSISRRDSLNKEFENSGNYVKAQPSGSKFTNIKRRSDYVQYGKAAKDRENIGPRKRRNSGSKTPKKNRNSGGYNDSFESDSINHKSRQPLGSLDNSPVVVSHQSFRSKPDFRFSVTPKKTTSLNIVSDDIINKQPIRKWAPANLNTITPDKKSQSMRKTSSRKNHLQLPAYGLSKTRSMEHLY
ncbi:hypothetical protein LOTGIDRAFT_157886 [Lottia gigantea]|uniref:XK-related protein n=1 Tax=Lottia gigantea TaxID=225164 RepID=V4CF30_LOTGI|nr:hypothetical protein LOTGIDRAFT_157886 [Lottia gigantea]ESP00605.1 hypothetical protein LOTGIDRAFT_157886 [Lottia gigantea]